MTTTMEGIATLLAGFLFFTSCFAVTYFTIEHIFGWKLSKSDIFNVSVKSVSAIQAMMSFVVGLVITSNCQKNIMMDKHWLTNTYAWFGIPYFYYDLVVMCIGYCYQNPELFKKSHSYRILQFSLHNKAMIIHHFFLPFLFFPVIVYFRKGIGDFFIGIFYQIELATPFISIRNIMVQLQMKDTPYYIIAGLLMIGAFAVCRVLVFPYLYWKYSIHANIPVFEVPFTIPLKCNIGCFVILVLQAYFLFIMIRGAFRVFYKIYQKKRKV